MRYAMLVDDGVVEVLQPGDSPGVADVSTAEKLLARCSLVGWAPPAFAVLPYGLCHAAFRCIVEPRRGTSAFTSARKQHKGGSAMKVKELMHKGVDWVGPKRPSPRLRSQSPARRGSIPIERTIG
jgi:hypothetical protein